MKSADTFDDFYHATRNRLLHQMYAMTGNLADAQDCVQEAYARAWQRWEQVSEHASPEAWLRTVAWRIAASRWRKFRNGVAAIARHGPPSHTPEPSPDNVALVAALKQIPEAQRRTIVLHHLADLPVDEVARELGVATGTVKARLSRGRAALAELLREDTGQGRADHGQPTAYRPIPAQPDTAEAGAGAAQSGADKPGSGKPGSGKPGSGKPDAAQPDSGQSDAGPPAPQAADDKPTDQQSTEESDIAS